MSDKDQNISLLSSMLAERKFAESANFIEKNFKTSEITRILHNITEQGLGLICYAFANYMIQKNPRAFWHKVAACIASESLDNAVQGHNTGLYHILAAIELDEDDWMLQEYALVFYQEGLLSKDKARQFALQVIVHEPKNKLALKVLAE